MEEGMDSNANGAADAAGTEQENPKMPEGPTPADNYDGLIDAKGLDIFAKECIAPLVGTVASLADSSLKLSERVEEMEKKVPSIIKVPVVTAGSYTYNRNEQGPEISGFDPNSITVTGATGTNAGDYTLTLALKNPEKQVWDDDTTAPRTYSWSIAPKTVETPVLTDANVMYNGAAQSPTLPSVNADEILAGGTTEATDAGTYTVMYSLANTNNYIWPDGTTAPRSEAWTITPKKLEKPTLSDASKTYSGSSQSPTLPSVNANEIQISGDTAATEAGNYAITYTLANTSNYIWSDDTTAPKSDTWTINRAAGSLALNTSSIKLGIGTTTGTITATRSGNGAISATSSNTAVAAVSVSGTTITITAKGSGSATITVNCAAGTNHNAASSKTASVTVEMASPTLASNNPATIKAAAQAGQAANLWKVGDKIPIAVKGTVGSLAINGTYYAFILGFNHNSSVEGGNSIHFQFGKDASGKDIAFVDEGYGSDYGKNEKARFSIHNTLVQVGWENCYMRKTICPAFLSALPSEWQSVIADCKKYSDNALDVGNTASNVTATRDKIWLLAEYEVFGKRTQANNEEQNHQKQYDYYKNGNSKMKYAHESLNNVSSSDSINWWLRSVRRSTIDEAFCIVGTSGYISTQYVDFSGAFSPGFKVA